MKRNSRLSLENDVSMRRREPSGQRKESLREKMISSLELPKDLMLGAAILTVTGNQEILIANYKGILEYEDSFIRVQTKNCRILISGAHLAIDYYTNEEMKITGTITDILYEN